MKKSQVNFKEQMKNTGNINGLIEEVFSGTTIIKAYNYENNTTARFDEANKELYEASRKAQFLSGIMNPVTNAFNNFAYILICVFGSFFVINGQMSFGNITAFIMYQKQYSSPITLLTSVLNMLQPAVASAERVFELLDETEEPETSDKYVKLENVKGEVSFEHLQFGYTPDKLLVTDINVITRHDLRDVFGMVLQDTWLFNGSISDNISYGKKNVTEEDVLTAAQAAQIDFFVTTLPARYDTVINEEAGWDEIFAEFTKETGIPIRHICGEQMTHEKTLL